MMRTILDFLSQLFNTEGFPPRWFCGTGWQPFTGWFMITADLLVFAAYLSIPLLLLFFVSRKKEVVFPKIFWLFAAFIFACGVSHLMDAIMFWWPAYRFNALERFITGLISWATVFALIPVIPQALQLKSPLALEKEVEERKKAEEQLRTLNANLEHMVAQRTRDLDEKAWQLEAANRELEAFSYSVSHDLKSPLRKIEQFSELIQQQSLEQVSDDLRIYLDRISANAGQMRTLIEDLLRFSRVANAELVRETIDLSAMAQQILVDLLESDPNRQVEISVQPGVKCVGDYALVHVVLENLLNNAWKYTSKTKYACIEFSSRPLEGQTAYFVKDNGAGFDMRSVDRIFKPFQRLHHVREFPGSGIGLANVQRVVSRHGGRVWACGEVGKGATFAFTLKEVPVEQDENQKPADKVAGFGE